MVFLFMIQCVARMARQDDGKITGVDLVLAEAYKTSTRFHKEVGLRLI